MEHVHGITSDDSGVFSDADFEVGGDANIEGDEVPSDCRAQDFSNGCNEVS
jgi:hypothetical protein